MTTESGHHNADALPLTGERTIPDLPEENYWFRRHEIAYQHVLPLCEGKRVLEAGSGEGYGAAMIAEVAQQVTGVDYNAEAVEHVRRKYPKVTMLEGNLAALPCPDNSVDIVVNFQVIEHLWDQVEFLKECARVLVPGGTLLVSTPNRITFTPDSDTPLNPYHTRELSGAELEEILIEAGFFVDSMLGVYHNTGLVSLDTKWDGSLIGAQLKYHLANQPWPQELAEDVAGVKASDFLIHDPSGATSEIPDTHSIDTSLDLLAIATTAPH